MYCSIIVREWSCVACYVVMRGGGIIMIMMLSCFIHPFPGKTLLLFAGVLGDCMTTSTTVGLVVRRTESGFWIRHIGHVLIRRRCWRHRLGLLLCRSLDEPSLDSHPPVGKILATIVADLFVPDPSRPLAIEASNNGCSFGRSVDTNTPVLVIDLRKTY